MPCEVVSVIHFDSPNLQDSFNLALFCGIHEKFAMGKFIVDVVHDFVSSLQPDVGRGFLHVSNVFLLDLFCFLPLSPPGWRVIVVTVLAGGRAAWRAAARLAEPIFL